MMVMKHYFWLVFHMHFFHSVCIAEMSIAAEHLPLPRRDGKQKIATAPLPRRDDK